MLFNHLYSEKILLKLDLFNSEIMEALNHLGYNPRKELPIVSKIKADVAKFGHKEIIIKKIKQLEKELEFEEDKKRLIWNEKNNNSGQQENKNRNYSAFTFKSKDTSFSSSTKNTKSTKTMRYNNMMEKAEGRFLENLINESMN